MNTIKILPSGHVGTYLKSQQSEGRGTSVSVRPVWVAKGDIVLKKEYTHTNMQRKNIKSYYILCN